MQRKKKLYILEIDGSDQVGLLVYGSVLKEIIPEGESLAFYISLQ